MHVFTYGTLMFPQVWQAVVGRSFRSVEGTAHGYAIYRVVDAVFPGIAVAAENESVEGVIYLDVDEASIARLDTFEDDFYERQGLWVDCADGQRRIAEAYVVPDQNRAVLTSEPWHRDTFLSTGGLEHFIQKFQGFGRVSTQEQQQQQQ